MRHWQTSALSSRKPPVVATRCNDGSWANTEDFIKPRIKGGYSLLKTVSGTVYSKHTPFQTRANLTRSPSLTGYLSVGRYPGPAFVVFTLKWKYLGTGIPRID